jgi:integrating conjugative element protein (TIGR03756 family)
MRHAAREMLRVAVGWLAVTGMAGGLAAPPPATRPHDCLRPAYLGQCFWLVCTPFGCDVETSAKLGHFTPDLVITVTNGTARGGIEVGSPGAPHRGGGEGFGRNVNLSYRAAHAAGHPLARLGYCPSEAVPLQPYYLSTLDPIGWDWGIPEVLYPPAAVPGLREIGTWPVQSWGPVYPRSGWSLQAEEPKAAAIAAQRVGDIVTRALQPHIYLELASGGVFTAGGKLVWRPVEGLSESSALGGDFELGAPAPTPGLCQTFGQNDLPPPLGTSLLGWSAGQLSPTGDYVYTLWRPYSCCEVKGTFLYDVAVPYPPL